MVKKTNKRLLARVCSLIGVLLLMCCMIFPASAAYTTYYYSVLPFDSVRLVESSSSVIVLPWAGGVWSSVSDDASIGYPDAGYGFTNVSPSFGDNLIIFDMALSAPTSSFNEVVFYADDAVISTSALRDASYVISFGLDSGVSARVTISFTACRIVELDNSYQVQTKAFYDSYHASDSLDIMECISEMMTDGNYVPSSYVRLTDLTVSISDCTAEDNWLLFRSDVRSSRPDLSDWFAQYKLTYKTEIIYNAADPSDVSFVDWLAVAVGGFLDFELWPGMSLNEIMWVVLVAGVLFWFLKLTV